MNVLEQKNREAARQGAEKLDQIDPNWFTKKHISLTRLDLSSPTACIAGQLLGVHYKDNEYGERVDPIREKFYEEANGGFINSMKEYDDRYGFEVNDPMADIDAQYKILDDEWKSLIRERRANAGKA